MLLIEPNSAAMLLRVKDFVFHFFEYGIAAPVLILFLISRLCRAGNLESIEIPETKDVASNLLMWPTDRIVTYSVDYYRNIEVEHQEFELTTR